MVQEKEIFLVRLMKLADGATIFIAFIAAYYITSGVRVFFDLGPLAFASSYSLTGVYYFLFNHLWLVLITVPTWVTLMSLDSVYEKFRTKLFIEISWRVFRMGCGAVLFMGSGAFLFKMNLTSRLYVAVFAITAYIFLIIEKFLWRWFLDYTLRQGYNLVNVLIVGTGKRAQEFIEVVKAHSNWGYGIVGLVDDDPKLLGKSILGYEIIGRIHDIPRILKHTVVDKVIFVVPRLWLGRIEEAILHCEREGISTAVSVDLFKPKLAKLSLANFAGIPLLQFQTFKAKEGQLFLKRVMDLLISFSLLILLIPVFIVTALAIKLSSPGPVFFKQVRSGLNGRKFTVIKFRSMVMGAERRRQQLERHNEMKGSPVFKIRKDPRVTRLGRVMRKLSIDELPQLINVLKGDMSLVGPRPPLPAEVDLYESWQRRRLSMKPGITCIWQVSGRNKIHYDRWMEMDLEYIDQFSIWLDIKILIRTFFVVIVGYGAV
jgi:exopolysaccharide biosynthesis polyprenyl glycosylphosphotransferase